MALSEDLVLEELKKVIDPELFVNIVDLGLIYEVRFHEPGAASEPGDNSGDNSGEQSGDEQPATESRPAEAESRPDATDSSEANDADGDASSTAVEGKVNVSINMTMTSPMCPAGPQLVAQSKQVVSQLEEVGEVEVKVVMDPPWGPERMTDDARDQLGIF